MVYPKLAADEREATGPLRVPYPTGNNGIAKFKQFLALDVAFLPGFVEESALTYKLCSLLVYVIY